jgi:hypothetical protein
MKKLYYRFKSWMFPSRGVVLCVGKGFKVHIDRITVFVPGGDPKTLEEAAARLNREYFFCVDGDTEAHINIGILEIKGEQP